MTIFLKMTEGGVSVSSLYNSRRLVPWTKALGSTPSHYHRRGGGIIRSLYCLVWHEPLYHRGTGSRILNLTGTEISIIITVRPNRTHPLVRNDQILEGVCKVRYVGDVAEMNLGYTQDLPDINLRYTCDILEIYLVHIWDIPEINIRYSNPFIHL